MGEILTEYGRERKRAKTELMKDCGWSASDVRKSETLMEMLAIRMGFEDNYDVRRVADRCGRRVA